MATLLPAPVNSKKSLRAVKIDMTPMVDLGFLLITFFIFTTTITQPTITQLTMPQKTGIQEVQEETLLTAILHKDKVIVYEGEFTKALAKGQVVLTDYNLQSGLGYYVRQKQQSLQAAKRHEELLVAIKPLPSASYQQVLTALDEMKINGVSRYGIMELTAAEKAYAIDQ